MSRMTFLQVEGHSHLESSAGMLISLICWDLMGPVLVVAEVE